MNRRLGQNKEDMMAKKLTFRVGVASLAMLAGAAFAAPPANDDFAGAAELTGTNGTVTVSNVEATREEGEEDLGLGSQCTVWYRWTAAKDSTVIVDTFGSDFDTYLGVFTGEDVAGLADLEFVCDNDDASGAKNNESRVLFEAESGKTYYILAGGCDDSAGTLKINWETFDGGFKMLVSDRTVTGYVGELPDTLSVDDWPDGVRHIGAYAFSGCENLTSVAIPDSVVSIGEGAFADCYSLASVAIPESVVRVEMEAFAWCEALTTITMPESVATIGWRAFTGCSGLADANGFIVVGDVLYGYVGDATDVVIPGSVTRIGPWAFESAFLTSVVIPESVTAIGYGSFNDCEALEEVSFAGDMYKIKMSLVSAFAGTPWLENHEFPPPVNDNFADAIELSGEEGSVEGTTIGATLEDEDGDSFGAGGVWWKWTAPAAGLVKFTGSAAADSYLAIYTSAREYVGGAGEEIEVEKDVTYYIAMYHFNYNDGGYVKINWAFGDGSFKLIVRDGVVTGFLGACPAEVVVPDGVTELGGSAFDADFNESVTNIVSVVLPESLRKIGNYAFWGCSSLESVVLNEGLEEIGYSVFRRCAMLKSVTLPSTVKYIEYCRHNDYEDDYYWFEEIDGTVNVLAPRTLKSDIWSYERSFDLGDEEYNEETGDWEWVENVVTTKVEVAYYTLVELDAGDGTLAESEVHRRVVGDVFGTLPEPTREGYTFVGWLLDGTAITADTEIPDGLGAATLTAQWRANRYTVSFDANGGTGMMADFALAYDEAKPLPDCVYERPAHEFVGWAIAPDSDDIAYLDGEIVENLTAIDGGAVRLYAIWERTTLWAPVAAPGGTGSGTGGDAAFDGAMAEIYDGYVYNGTGVLVGTLQAKTAKAKVNKKTGKATVKVSVSIQLVGEAKTSVKGGMDADLGVFDAADKSGRALHLEFGANGLTGTYGSFYVDGAENKFSSKESADKAVAAATLSTWAGVYAVAWDGGEGWNELTVTVAAKGKVKVAGVMANGVKVSAKGQMLIGDGGTCLIPIVVTKKVSLAFNLWLSKEGISVVGLGDGAVVGKATSLNQNVSLHVDKSAALWSQVRGTILRDYLPDGLPIGQNGTKWVLPKAGKVAYARGTTDVDETKLLDNPAALKLTYKAKDGSFKGSFKVYGDDNGKLKSTTVNITGVVIDGVGYGTALIKNVGSVPITISAQ